MILNFDGTPAGSPSSYETFGDLYLDTAKQSAPGYLGSFITNPTTSGTAYMSDTNGDSIPDSFTENWINPSDGALMTTTGSFIVDANNHWTATVTAGATTMSKVHYGRLAYDTQGQVVGTYVLNIDPVFTLTPDAVPANALIATFTMPAIPTMPGTWSLLDNDLNGKVDYAQRLIPGLGQNLQPEIQNYTITWSDATHFTARLSFTMNCSNFDSIGRPTFFNLHNTPLPITWLTAKTADNAVATLTNINASLQESVTFYDTNGDAVPDKLSFTSLSLVTGITDTGIASISEWATVANPTVQLEFQTSTFQGDVFTGSIKGTSSNPTSVAMASYFMGGGGSTTAAPTTITDPATGKTTITTPTMYSGGVTPDSTPLVTDPALANPTILNVTRPAGVTFIANDITGTAITDLRSHLLAAVDALLPSNTTMQSGIDAYLATLPTADQANVTVRTLIFSSVSVISPGALVIDGNTNHQEALVIDTTGLVAGSQLNLDYVDLAFITGEGVFIRGGLGANLVYAGSGAQDIKLGVDDDTIHGGDGNDNLASTTGNDWLYGEAGNDTLTGGADNDHLDGGTGDDTAVFSGNFADYNISYNSGTDTYTIADKVVGRDGTDMVTGVEHFRFADHLDMLGADIYAPGNSVSSFSTGTIVVGVGGVGLLAWLLL